MNRHQKHTADNKQPQDHSKDASSTAARRPAVPVLLKTEHPVIQEKETDIPPSQFISTPKKNAAPIKREKCRHYKLYIHSTKRK